MTEVKVDGIPVNYIGLPERCRETVRLYLEHGRAPGSGWTAIIQNDLRAVIMVDQETLADLPQIYRWMVNYAPSMAWGSLDKMRLWMKNRAGRS